MTAPFRSLTPLLDRQVEVETPEHIAIGYDLADLGSRFTALLLDGIILVGGLLVLVVGLPLLVVALGGVADWLAGIGLGAIILLVFCWLWGYFVYFEGLREGQTPGKRRMGIRVVHDGGYPLTVRGAAIRNLLRLVDIQPMPSWLVGGAVMMLHPQTKRLGDLAAGTVVVRERLGELLPEERVGTGDAGAPPRLRAAEYSALAGFVARRHTLRAEVRERIAARLGESLGRHLDGGGAEGRLEERLLALHIEEAARQASRGGGSAGSAQAAVLLRRQRSRWDEYRALLERARKLGLAALPEADVSRFAALYREISADLARSRSYGGSPQLSYTLERWVGAGHNLLYRPVRRSWRRLGGWLAGGFPALVRRRWRPIALATAFFYLPGILVFGAIRGDPGLARAVVPPEMMARAENASVKEVRGEGYVEIPDVFMPAMATGIIANNVQVTFVAFAGGILAGAGTLAILVLNGVHLGSVAAVFANEGGSMQLWSFVLPHGVIELTAICIAGGAGLWLGSGILLPGRRTRREALVRRGREAVALLGGVVTLLLVAGLIEGFVSPSSLPREVKLGFGLAIAGLFSAYLALGGRGAAGRTAAEAENR